MCLQKSIKRQEKLKKALGRKGLEGILITNLTNVKYISGFTGSAASCFITPEGQYFITDGRYIEQSKSQVKFFDRFIGTDSHLKQIKDNNLNPDGLKIAFEADHMSYSLYEKMKDLFPNTYWSSTSMILRRLSICKG